MNDPNWQDGDYYGTGRYPRRGQALAGMASSRSYNNAPSFNDDKEADVPGASPYDKVTNNFAFEGELWANALANAERNIDANDRGHSGSSEFSQMIPPMTRFIDSLPGGTGARRPSGQP